MKKSDDFHLVRGDRTWAGKFKVNRVPMVVFTDADGDEIHRSAYGNADSLASAMSAASAKYAPKPIAWAAELPATAEGAKLLVVGFDDEKGEALKVLESRTIVKYHSQCVFVKLPFEKNGEAAKKWGVSSVPAIVLCDAAKGTPIERLTGKESPTLIREAILRAIRSVEAKK